LKGASRDITIEESKLLSCIDNGKSHDLDEICKALEMDQSTAASYIDGLEKIEALSVIRSKLHEVQVTPEGKEDIKEGFPEERLIRHIKASGPMGMSSKVDSVALGWAKKNGWVEIEGSTIRLSENGKLALDKVYKYGEVLSELGKMAENSQTDSTIEHNQDIVKDLVKRGLVIVKERSQIGAISITDLGKTLLSGKPKDLITTLSRDIIKSSEWKTKEFKSYNVTDPTERAYPARIHPSHRFFSYIRSIFLSMGFSEVVGPIIDNAFWNFDALFSPQDHPTRDMQDTFFLSNPKEIGVSDLEVLSRVRRMHKKGWKSAWRESLAKQALLRTHNTSVSVKNILKYGNLADSAYPIKLFSLGKVFRNESIDYKHLNELNQLDGIIIGDSLTLSNLIFTMKEFYSYLGIDVKFKPSYFPFVEPGMEGYYHNEEHDDDIELFGSGIIRKEITKAMGTNKTVLAWGIGLDRLMFNYIETDSLSEIYRNQIGWLRDVKYKKDM